MGRDDVGDRSPERAQCAGRFLAVGHVARVAGGENEHLLPVPFSGQERQRRRLAHHGPDRKLVRRLVHDPAELGKKSLRFIERMHHKPGKDLGPKRMKPELKRRHDAEIAPAAS